MIKGIIKMFLKPSRLAKTSAEAVQKAVNGSGKQETIEKYTKLADQAVDVSKRVTTLLNDGVIDDSELAEIEEWLEPLYQRLVDMI